MKYQGKLLGGRSGPAEQTYVSLGVARTNASNEFAYTHDSRGNMTGVTTQVAAGTAIEVGVFNDLNQILTNAVTPVGGGTTNWTYTWNLDGTLATKFDGTNTYAYTWDPGGDQRLLSMSLNGATQVAFTYDSMGRMLTRTPYSAGVAGTPTNFEWDHWDCVREFAPAGTYRYYAPQGELVTFDYTPTAGATSTYCLHADALGSVRMITDSSGASVAHYEYDAWGNLLASSSDISFGFNYRYVGSLGVRWDATLGMYYCRQRWYDPTLQRFISRDPIGLGGGRNLYLYGEASPVNNVDPSGMEPQTPSRTRKIPATPALDNIEMMPPLPTGSKVRPNVPIGAPTAPGKIQSGWDDSQDEVDPSSHIPKGGMNVDKDYFSPDFVGIKAHCICPELSGWSLLPVAEINSVRYPGALWSKIKNWSCTCSCLYSSPCDDLVHKVRGRCIPDATWVKGS